MIADHIACVEEDIDLIVLHIDRPVLNMAGVFMAESDFNIAVFNIISGKHALTLNGIHRRV